MSSSVINVRSRRVLGLLIASLASGSCGLIAPRALAQQLEEITVTAQKREQNLQDVPLAVSAFSGDSLQQAGIKDVWDLARAVPSLQVQTNTSSAATNYRIRRVGNLGNIPTFEPAVGVFQDGAFRNRPLFTSGDMFDIERIEVLRGPQSTLYGKNTTAGVLAIYTRAPSEEFTGSGEFTAGRLEGGEDASMYRFVGGVSGPLSGTVGGSLGLSYNRTGHIMDSALSASDIDANDVDRIALRGQLQWQPTDALNLRFIAGGTHEDDDQSLGDVYIAPGSGAEKAWNILEQFGLAQACSSNDPTDRHHCSREPATTKMDAGEATLLADYSLGNGWTVTSITSWDWFDFKGTMDDVVQLASPLLKFHDTQESESWQQELRLSSAGGEELDWLLGTFLYYNDFERGDNGDRDLFQYDTYSAAPIPSLLLKSLFGAPVPVPFALPGQNGILDASQDTGYLGLFGQATWNVSEKFAVTGGLRWQREQKDASLEQGVTLPGLSLVSARLLPASVGGDLDRDTDELTWSIQPQYFPDDDLTLFATIAHGFKSGGFNIGWGATPMSQREFADEDIMHYEAGLKGTLLDGRMQFALSGFYTQYQDYQDAAFISQQFTVGNAQKAELSGVEIEGKLLLGEHVTGDFGVSYADFTYQKYTNGLCYPGRTPDGSDPGTCDLSAEHPVNAPEWTSHLGLLYETDVGWGDVYARADWSWSDEYNTSFSADPRLVQDSYSWLDLRLGTHWQEYEFVAWVDNATDEDVVNLDPQLNLFQNDPSYQSWMQAPRTWGVTVRADF